MHAGKPKFREHATVAVATGTIAAFIVGVILAVGGIFSLGTIPFLFVVAVGMGILGFLVSSVTQARDLKRDL